MNAKFDLADLKRLEAAGKFLKIKKILGADFDSFSILRWQSPEAVRPREAAYVLVKLRMEEGGFCCEEAAYEQEQYWPLCPPSDMPFLPSAIAAWSYFPYDPWVDPLGNVESEGFPGG